MAAEPIPGMAAEVGAWIAFGDAMAGDLDDANAREKQTLAIVGGCEARDDALVKSLTHKPWWQFGG